MYIQSGEWVTILRARIKEKSKIFKSLRFRIIMLLILVSSIPCFMVKEVIVGAYEDRSVAWRTAEIQEQCTILSHQLAVTDYLNNPVSEEVDAELSMLSNIYNGRALVIDEEYKVVKDTFGSDEGKTGPQHYFS